MRLERVNYCGRCYHSVNGKPIRRDTLDVIGRELFTDKGWEQISQAMTSNGFAEIRQAPLRISTDETRNALDNANKKIASLENQVAKLTGTTSYLEENSRSG